MTATLFRIKLGLLMMPLLFSTTTFALDQLYDKDKNKLKADLYVSCVKTNKSSELRSGVSDSFLESHCKCFSVKLSSEASMDKNFVKSFNDKNTEEQMAILSKMAAPLNQACFEAASEKYGQTSMTSASPEKISDKVGLTGLEKDSFIRTYNYQCAQEYKNDSKVNQSIVAKFCGCVSEYISTRVSNRDLYLSTRNGVDTKRYGSAQTNGSDRCLNEIRQKQ